MGYEGIIKDITAAKQAQEQIEQERRLVASILELVPVAIFVVDKNHKVLHWNKGCEELTGWSRQDVLGTDKTWQVFNRPKGCVAGRCGGGQRSWPSSEAIYGKEKLRRSAISPDAWEAENYFESLGGRPKELFFTAAPLQRLKWQTLPGRWKRS